MKSIIKKMNAILNKRQKGRIGILMVMILIGGLLETLGVSLIVPLGTAIADETAFMENSVVKQLCSWWGIQDITVLVSIMLVALILIFVGKNAFLILLCYVQSRFINNSRCRAATNLLEQYLNKPYEYYLYADSATILRTIYGDMDNVFNLLLQCMNLAAEVVVAICLAVVLLIIDYKMMCVMAVILGGTLFIILKFIKPKLSKAGESARVEQSTLYKWILQSVSGIKDVKILRKETYFVSAYRQSAERYAGYQISNNVLSSIPRMLIEVVAIVGILLYILICLLTGTPLSAMLGVLMAFATAAIRLLPSINRINTYMANIAYYQPALDYIYDVFNGNKMQESDVVKNSNSIGQEISLIKEIQLKNITYRYPNTLKDIFKNAELTIPVGKAIGIIGSSGSGKTTIVDILLGLLELQEGKILSDGKDIFDDYAGWLSNVGYIPQAIYMLDDSIRNNIAFGVNEEEISDVRIWEVLEEAQMKEFVEQLPERLDTQIGERGVRISGGQRQRLGIARALYHNPELLIFDEATSALDNDTETAIMEAINKLHGHKTLVIIAHRLRTIENCDMIFEVKDGKIVPCEIEKE